MRRLKIADCAARIVGRRRAVAPPRWPTAVVALAALLASGAAAAQSTATITVDLSKAAGTISPLLYGQFAEFMFQDVKGGLWAELLRDRSFDGAPNSIGLPRDWERDPDDRNDDEIKFAWDASASVDKPPDPSAVTHALRVTIPVADGQRRGIRQGWIPLRGGLPYTASLWIRSQSYTGRVTFALEQDRTDGNRYAAASVTVAAGDWKKYEVQLTPTADDPAAKLAILFEGRGRFWIDDPSLVPGDAVGGVRADVMQRIRAEKPRFLRWPGGNVAQDYHWQWGVGPRDMRPTWTNLSWGNEPEPADFGTDEYLEFCRNIGAVPTLVINVEGRGATPQEAADWVQYVNGNADSPMGKLRAQNGHPAPYGVKIWEIGNEIWGNWVRAHSDAQTYAANFNRYVEAMRAVDPSLKFIAVGDNNMNWNRAVLRLAGRNIDYLAVHHYYGVSEMAGDARNLMAHPLHYERFYRQLAAAMHELVPSREIKLAINEWNTSLPLPRQHSMESALYGARLMNVFERSDGFVAMSAVSDMVNGWIGGVIQASRHDVFVTPTYLAIKLYNEHLGSERVEARVSGPTFDTTKEGSGVPVLDAVASRNPASKELYVKIVNTDPSRAIAATVEIPSLAASPLAVVETINGAALDTSTTFRTPDAVSVHRSEVAAGPRFTVELPAHSVTVITVPMQ